MRAPYPPRAPAVSRQLTAMRDDFPLSWLVEEPHRKLEDPHRVSIKYTFPWNLAC